MDKEERTDRELTIGLKHGNEISFRKLFVKFGKKLYYFSLKHNLSHEEAEEIVQEVFAKVWERREELNIDLSFNAYVLTIARNLIINKSRKQLNRRLFEEYFINHHSRVTESVENEVFYKDLERIIKGIIKDLPPKVQLIFKLSRLEGFNNQEIAEKLQISKKTVENQMHTALKHIRKSLSLRKEVPLSALLVLLLLYC